MTATLENLHRYLAEAINLRGPGAGDRPVTVAEIYQNLVPYREVRERLGIESTGEYEHALLRLLAGEFGLARLEPANARDEVRAALESADPNLGIYRKFAACDVWIALDPSSAKPNGEPRDSAARHIEAPAASTAVEPPPPSPVAPPPPPPPAPSSVPRATGQGGESAMSAPAAQPTDVASTCAFCSEPLPTGRAVVYCPFCGKDQRRRPCPECAEVLERSWRFCIACGTDVGNGRA